MIISRHQNIVQTQNIEIGNLSFENVEKFRYLGLTVTNTNDIREEIERRMNLEYACYYSFFYFFLSLFVSSSSCIYPPPIQDLHPSGLRIQMPVGQMPVGGSSCLWTRTLDRYTRAGLPECVVGTMSVPLPEAAQDRTQTKDTHPIPGQELKFLTPPEQNPDRRVGRKGRYRSRHGDGYVIIHLRKFYRPVCFPRN